MTVQASGMSEDFAIMGLGQLGQLYGAGALRAGFRVQPIRRCDDPSHQLKDLSSGTPLLVAVGETDLPAAVAAIPSARHADIVLLQNELFPSRWRALELEAPSVLVPWVLKKPGLPVTPARRSEVFGRHAETLRRVHDALELPVEVLDDTDSLGHALGSKYVFILTINALGLLRDLSLGAWLDDAGPERDAVVRDALRLAEAKLGAPLPEAKVRQDFVEAMRGMAAITAKGRTALARVQRAVSEAQALGVEVPALRNVAASAGQ